MNYHPNRRHFLSGVTASAGVAALAMPALAQAQRPLKITVGGGPGSVPDVIARLVAARFGETAKRSVIVENRAGAGGITAIQAMLAEPRDGNTLALATIAQAVLNAYLFKNLPYDTQKDILPVSKLVSSTMVVASHPALKAASLKELALLPEAEQQKINISTPPQGTPPHLAALMLTQALNLKAVIVPFKTGPDALAAARKGEVQLTLDGPSILAAAVQTNELRALAVTGEKRVAALPAVPTVAEAGYPAARVETWMGLVAPAGVPGDVIHALNRAIRDIYDDQNFTRKIEGAGFTPVTTSIEEFAQSMRQEHERWGKVIQSAGLTLG